MESSPLQRLPHELLKEILGQIDANPFAFRFGLTSRKADAFFKHFSVLRVNSKTPVASNKSLAEFNPVSLAIDHLSDLWWHRYSRVAHLVVQTIHHPSFIPERLGLLGASLRILVVRAHIANYQLSVDLITTIGKTCPHLVGLSLVEYSFPQIEGILATAAPAFPNLVYLSAQLNSILLPELRWFGRLEFFELLGATSAAELSALTFIPSVFAVESNFSWRHYSDYICPLSDCSSITLTEARVRERFAQWGHLKHGAHLPAVVAPYFTPSFIPPNILRPNEWRVRFDDVLQKRIELLISLGVDVLQPQQASTNLGFVTAVLKRADTVDVASRAFALIPVQLAYNRSRTPPIEVDLKRRLLVGEEEQSLLQILCRPQLETSPLLDHTISEYGISVNYQDANGRTALHCATSGALTSKLLGLGADHTLRDKYGTDALALWCAKFNCISCPTAALINQRPQAVTAEALRHLLHSHSELALVCKSIQKHLTPNAYEAMLYNVFVLSVFDKRWRVGGYPYQLFKPVWNALDAEGNNILWSARDYDYDVVVTLMSFGVSPLVCNHRGDHALGHWLRTRAVLGLTILSQWQRLMVDTTTISQRGETLLMAALRGQNWKASRAVLKSWAARVRLRSKLSLNRETVEHLLLARDGKKETASEIVDAMHTRRPARKEKFLKLLTLYRQKFTK